MLLELFALRNYKTLERFTDTSDSSRLIENLMPLIIIIIIISLIFTGGAISLSWNYNNYIGTSGGMKIFYAILVFIAPTIYYPFYAIVLNPINKLKSLNTKVI